MSNETRMAVRQEPLTAITEYIPMGCPDKVKVSVSIVKTLLCKPTRSGRTCSTADALKYIMMLTAQRLNPFLGDCWLVGYDGDNGTAEFQMLTSYHALLKRAELHPKYHGLEYGVIVRDGDSVKELQGDFHLDEQILLGAWARCHKDGLKVPTEDRILLKNYIKKTKYGDPTQF